MNDVCRFSRDHVVECSERTVCLLVLNQYVYVGDVSGGTSPIIWQRVMVGQQIICTNVGPAWKHCFRVIGCLLEKYLLFAIIFGDIKFCCSIITPFVS